MNYISFLLKSKIKFHVSQPANLEVWMSSLVSKRPNNAFSFYSTLDSLNYFIWRRIYKISIPPLPLLHWAIPPSYPELVKNIAYIEYARLLITSELYGQKFILSYFPNLIYLLNEVICFSALLIFSFIKKNILNKLVELVHPCWNFLQQLMSHF